MGFSIFVCFAYNTLAMLEDVIRLFYIWMMRTVALVCLRDWWISFLFAGREG